MTWFPYNLQCHRNASLALAAALCALATAGCQQSSPTAAPASPWGTTSPTTSASQQQMNMMAEMWRRQNEQMQASAAEMQRRQMQQMSELQRQAQQQAELARQRQAEDARRRAQLSRSQQENQGTVEQLRRRAMQLDLDNQDLHAQVAKSQQETRLWKDQVAQLNQRLDETAKQLSVALRARQQSEQKINALQASVRRRGGATITANSSVAKSLTAISIPGLQVRQDGDVVRMELPSDKLFAPRSATLLPAAVPLIQKVAEAVAENYPQHIIGVEGYTDSDPMTGTAWRSNHQLSAAQSLAVLDQLAANKAFSTRQLFEVGHGANHPLASNATPAGKARNRRVEIVVYPETVNGN